MLLMPHVFRDCEQIRLLNSIIVKSSGLTLGLRPANERRRYFVTQSLIVWVQA